MWILCKFVMMSCLLGYKVVHIQRNTMIVYWSPTIAVLKCQTVHKHRHPVDTEFVSQCHFHYYMHLKVHLFRDHLWYFAQCTSCKGSGNWINCALLNIRADHQESKKLLFKLKVSQLMTSHLFLLEGCLNGSYVYIAWSTLRMIYTLTLYTSLSLCYLILYKYAFSLPMRFIVSHHLTTFRRMRAGIIAP